MNAIVFDLEWNQSPTGKQASEDHLPFEIIEIGAMKLNDNKEPIDHFHRLIKPQVYHRIHSSIHDVIHMDYEDLVYGEPFPEAAKEFIRWCGSQGEEWRFFTWGNQDVMELQRNLKYYDILEELPGPVYYYDVQKLFAIRYEDRKLRRSLEYAVDYLKLEKQMKFHRALEDAWYTAQVLARIEDEWIFPNSSLDVYQNPKTRQEEIHISYSTYDKYVSREFSDRESLMLDREVVSTRCPVCHHAAKKKIRWFPYGQKNFYSLSNCKDHGFVKGKIRIRKTEEEQVFTVKTVKLIGEEEAEEIRKKRELLRKKRSQKQR